MSSATSNSVPLEDEASDTIGASTVILLFQPGQFVFDDDLVTNSKSSLETLVRTCLSFSYNSFAWVRVLDIILLWHKW
jgi:hypothetical protein